ncbi:MAG TPA: RelA/SpoT domain-containing protein [Mycobacteriales bacterium]|nr:RelA/SpoT domain-containing protein [Mycobacteriales bacterium]
MTLPISKTQLDKLGKRLAASEQISDADYELLEQVLSAYDELRDHVQGRLFELGFENVTGRVKTTGTLVEKLRREQGMALKGVQDVAGVRIVVSGGRLEQDRAVERVERAFRPNVKGKPKDRRDEPSSGYRAVHVIVVVKSLPIEVQIRTELQDLWAQAFERIGDEWGRAIRYGGLPDEPDKLISSGTSLTRRDLVRLLQNLSERIDAVERAQLNLDRVEQAQELDVDSEGGDEFQALLSEQEEVRELVERETAGLGHLLEQLLQAMKPGGGFA